MARLLFGGGLPDWAFSVNENNLALLIGGATITFWDQETGGNRLTDLTGVGGEAITQVTSSNGSDGRGLGQIPPFFGPDGAFEMWASASGGPRALITAANLGSFLGPVRATLEAHLSASNPNPHSTTLASLTDAAGISSATTGQLLAKDADGRWKPLTVPGVGGTVQITGDQTVSGTKTFENQTAPAAPRIVVNAAEGQNADLLQVWSSAEAGQGSARQKTTSVNSKGEVRLQSSKSDRPAVTVVAQVGQTAHVLQQQTSAGTPISWWEANGSWRAPNLGRSVQYVKAGTVAVGAGTFTWYNDTGVPLTLRSVRSSVVTAPAGASLIVDVNLNGATIFTTQASRPTIAAGAKTSGRVTGMNLTTIPDGASVTVDIDQIGSTTPGADLAVQLEVY